MVFLHFFLQKKTGWDKLREVMDFFRDAVIKFSKFIFFLPFLFSCDGSVGVPVKPPAMNSPDVKEKSLTGYAEGVYKTSFEQDLNTYKMSIIVSETVFDEEFKGHELEIQFEIPEARKNELSVKSCVLPDASQADPGDIFFCTVRSGGGSLHLRNDGGLTEESAFEIVYIKFRYRKEPRKVLLHEILLQSTGINPIKRKINITEFYK